MGEKIQLLYVEDSGRDADLTKTHFKHEAPEFKIDIAASGEECLKTLEKKKYEVLLLDYRLPDMTGLEILRQVMAAGYDLPVVMVTGSGDDELVVQTLKAGAKNYIPKHADYIAELPDVLRKVVVDFRKHVESGVTQELKHILYIEHHERDIDLLQQYFAEDAPNYLLETANSDIEALHILEQKHNYSALVVDLHIPEDGAVKFLRDVRQRGISVPAVVITGKGDEDSAIAVLRMGANDYVIKRDEYFIKLQHTLDNVIARFQLEKYIEFERLVSKISSKFIGLSGVAFEQAIQGALAEIGRFFEVDTVRLYRLSPHGDVVRIRNMWRSEHLAPLGEMSEIHRIKYPSLAAHYSRGESVVFGGIDECPQIPELLKILKFFGTKAGVGVPIEVDGSGVDVFAMDKVGSEHVWPKNIIEHSRAVGKVILSAMRRREAEVELQDSYAQIKRLKDLLEQENVYLQEEIRRDHRFKEIIGNSTELQYTLHRVEEIAPTDVTVLILGETGTGKDLIARAIHSASQRKDRQLVIVNCAALPPNLVESELFGHVRGAFSGAHSNRTGRFEYANGSTLFLDEIGEFPLELQAKLLRVLQDGEFERVGSSKSIKVDVRLIASTNRNLQEEIRKGRFREDLYYRLNIIPITLLPLRERKDDIVPLVEHFTQECFRKHGKEIKKITRKTMDVLRGYHWPGNVRELENTVERAVITSRGPKLQVELPVVSTELFEANKTLEEIERVHISKMLKKTGWKIAGAGGAAEILGMHSNTLRSRMEKLGIAKHEIQS